MRLYIVILILWILPKLGYSQSSLNISNGFPHTDSYDVTQDNRGFVWFATLDGLCRFDGSNVVTFKPNYSLDHNITNSRILNVIFDQQYHGLWLGTQGSGLLFFDIESEKFSNIKENEAGQFISDIFIDSGRRLWMTSDKGLYFTLLKNVEKPEDVTFEKIKTQGLREIKTIFEDHNQKIYFGTPNGIYKLVSNSNQSGYGFQKFLPEMISSCNVIAELKVGEFYYFLIGNRKGLFKFNFQTGEIFNYKNYAVSCIYVDETEQNIHVGTTNNGADIIKISDFIKLDTSISGIINNKQPEVKKIFKDSFGTLYTSVLGHGIYYSNSFNKKFISYPKASSNWKVPIKQVICFTSKNPNDIWIGTRGEGVVLMDRAKNSFKFLDNTTFDAFSNKNYISSLLLTKNNNLIVGTYDGLYVLNDINTDAIKKGINPKLTTINTGLENSRVNRLIEDKNGVIWVATSKGMLLMKNNKIIKHINDISLKKAKIELNFIYNIFLDEDSHKDFFELWVGTIKDGLYKLKLSKDYKLISTQFFNVKNQTLRSNWVTSIIKSKNQLLYVATLGGGLTVIDLKKNIAIHYNRNNGLLTDDVESILEDNEGNIWIGSKGLTKFDYKHKKFSYYDANDGLQSNSFKVWSAFKLTNGELIFGGINGFNIFNPASIVNNNIPPKLALTALNVENKVVTVGEEVEGDIILPKSISYSKEISLNHRIKSFSIDFSAIHTQNSDKKRYKYKLYGFDKDWIYTNNKRNFAYYSNLKPGEYKFLFQANNGDGIWSKVSTPLIINVLPSFWQSYYSYLVYFLIIIIIIYFSTKFALVKVKTKNEIQFQQFKQEQELKSYQDKVQFFTNISHELRTPLSLILTPIEQIFDYSNLSKEVFDKLDVVYKNSKRLKHLIDQLLNLRKYELGKVAIETQATDLYFFMHQIFSQFEDIAANNSLEFVMNGKENLYALIDVNKLDQVFLNLISNAIKFTPTHSKIEINLEQRNHFVCIEIKNYGSYIAPEIQTKIFEPFFRTEEHEPIEGYGLGLSIAKYLVELHKGTIKIDSQKFSDKTKSYTSFIVELPYLEDYHNSPAYQKNNLKKEKTIVVAEDNEDMRNLLIDYLKSEYDVIACRNGVEAMEAIKASHPDLILTDLMMPEMDGLSLIKTVRKTKFLAHIPIIIISAKGSEESKIEGLQALANDFIEKPFNLRILSLKIRNLIQSKEKLMAQGHLIEKLEPTEIQVLGYNEKVFSDVMADIEKNIENHQYTVSDLCDNINLSRSKLFRIIKSEAGMSINGLIIDVRLKRAAQLLKQNRYSVGEVMYMVGFENASHFNRSFKAKYDDTPKKYATNNNNNIDNED